MSAMRFMHVRNFGRKGRRNATIAYVVDDAKQEVRYGVALCSTNEQFVKKQGRAYAVGRLIVMPDSVSFSIIGSDRYRAVDAFLRDTIRSVIK